MHAPDGPTYQGALIWHLAGSTLQTSLRNAGWTPPYLGVYSAYESPKIRSML